MAKSLSSKIRAANQALIAGNELDAIGRYFSPDYVVHLTDRDLTGGHATIRRILKALRRSFPDMTVEVEILAQGKDRIAWQRTIRARHEGAFRGFPATGRKLTWRDMHVTRFSDGLIAEEWVSSDLAERLLLARKR